MMNRSRIYPVMVLLACLCTSARAIEPVVVLTEGTRVSLANQVTAFEEKERTFSIEEIISGGYDTLFHDIRSDRSVPVRYKRSLWTKAVVRSGLQENSEWIIKLWRHYSRVDCYLLQDGRLTRQQSGWAMGVNDRSVADPGLLFNLAIAPGATAAVYLHIETSPMWNNPSEIKAEVISTKRWIVQSRNQVLMLGLFLGLLLLTTAFWLANYFAGRRVPFLLALGISNTSLLFYFADANNLIASFLPAYPWYNIARYGAVYLWLPFFMISMAFQFANFGNLKDNHPRTIRSYYALTAFALLAVVLVPSLSLGESLTGAAKFIFIGWGAYHLVTWAMLWLKEQNPIGKIGIMDYLPMAAGLVIESLRQAHVVHDTVFTRNAFQIGTALSVTITFFTYLSFVKKLRRQRSLAQKEKEELITNQNILLEQKVEERTRELHEAQEELLKKEKLAALGKVASTLAHEIQNPLNFVKNFSELSAELSSELANAKSEEEKKKILSTLDEILFRIRHHGKRADGIIKDIQRHLNEGRGDRFFED